MGWFQHLKEYGLIIGIHGKWRFLVFNDDPIQISMVALKFRIAPACTCDGIVVVLVPYPKLLALEPVFPHPIWPPAQPFHAGYFFFGVIESYPCKINARLLRPVFF